jgi:peptide/nickel transport system permease protein
MSLLFIFVFSVHLRLLPTIYSTTVQGEGIDSALATLRQAAMPIAVQALFEGATLTRYVRTSMLNVLSMDYVRTARAKGLGERITIVRHALRNALIPVVTVLGIQFGRLLGGAVVTEAVFSYPGLGRLVVTSIQNRDYPVVQGALMLVVVIFLLTSIAVDLSYAYLDPRVTLRRGMG